MQQRPNLKDPLLFFRNFPQIRHKMFSTLAHRDLRECSTVNKLWHHEVNNFMIYKKCFAYVTGSCTEFRNLNALILNGITQSVGTIINGLYVDLSSNHPCDVTSRNVDSEFQCQHLTRLPLRFLHFQVSSCRNAQRLMSYILLESCESLEEVQLQYLDSLEKFLQRPVMARFPKLRVITVEPKFGASWRDAMELIVCAPNLERVVGLSDILDAAKLNDIKIRSLTGLHCVPYNGIGDKFVKIAHCSPQLTELQVYDLHNRTLPPSWSQPLMSLLEHVSPTLQNLSICTVELLKYFRGLGPALYKLQSLELFFPEEAEARDLSFTVAAMRLKSNLPALKSMRLDFSDHCYHGIYKRQAEVTSVEQATNVTSVLLRDPPCNVDTLAACITLFPSIKSIGFECIACADVCWARGIGHQFELSKIFSLVHTLQELKIRLLEAERAAHGFSMDGLLCGLTGEEAEQLKLHSRNEEVDLSALQLCTIRPSLRDAKSMKKLCVVFAPGYTYNENCFSEVSGFLAVRRLSQLKVLIQSYSSSIADELSWLDPFCEIVYLTDKKDWW